MKFEKTKKFLASCWQIKLHCINIYINLDREVLKNILIINYYLYELNNYCI